MNEDGKVEVDVYRKATHTSKYLDFHSHGEAQRKRAVVGFLFFSYLGAIFPSTLLVVLVVTLPSLWLSRVTHPPGDLAHAGFTSVFLVSVLVFAVSTFLSAFWPWALPFVSV